MDKCLYCGGEVKDKRRKYCSRECYTKAIRGKKICAVCGKVFWSAPSSEVRTCGEKCEKELRRISGISGTSAENLRKAQEASKISHNSGRFPENAIAKSWTIQSPDGTVYRVNNLKLWAEQNAEILPNTPLRFSDGIVSIKRTLKGKKKRGSYQYMGWKLIEWSEENDLRKDIPPKKKPEQRKQKMSEEERLKRKRERERERSKKKKMERVKSKITEDEIEQ